MKKIPTVIFLLVLISLTTVSREWVKFNSNWSFCQGDLQNAFTIEFDDSEWAPVSIPHDWAISKPFSHDLPANTGKLPWKDVGWYRKHFEMNSEDAGKQVYLVFDGIMAFPEVYINGNLAGKWDYGYNSFYLNISHLLNFGQTNVIAIKADTRNHDSRWYPGGGIYRKIQMLITQPVHVDVWGVFVKTLEVDDDHAGLQVSGKINHFGNQDEEVFIEFTVIDPYGNPVASASQQHKLIKGSSFDAIQNFTIREPKKWDVDNPLLYKLKTTVKTGEVVQDINITNFGIRTIEFKSDDGFWLNGRRLQLKGVNLHHDHGPLGAKFYVRAMERQLEIMKDMGCNAIRTSHNTAAPEVLALCDSMGILVFNEIFDKWDQKAGYMKGEDFLDFADRNIKNFVLRDRNHPCVFLWSVGNEMGDIQWNIDDGLEKLKAAVEMIKKYDPTRPVTMVCDAPGSVIWRHFDHYDVHCWNYGRRYLKARQEEPTKSVIISESASTVSTRGFYELPLPENKTDFTASLQVSSYDLNAPEWAEIADDDFLWQQEDTYVAGEFVWTGFDYLGEPTPYNDEAVMDGIITHEQSANSSFFGIVDMCGIPKDRYFLYKSYWAPERNTIHILPHWNWAGKENENIPVFVYTNEDCAELFLNGASLGKQCKKPESAISTERFRLMWHDVPYQPGELKAIAYKGSEQTGVTRMVTSKEPHMLKMTPDRENLKATGEDLSYILVEAFDIEGNPCPLADHLVNFEIAGPAVIEGVGNGNPQSTEPFVAGHRKLFNGKAMLIIRTLENNPGKITITANADQLMPAKVSLKSK